MGPEVRFEWVNFVWRGFTNVEGDQSTVGREEQQYSCDVEVCSPFDECKPVCIDAVCNEWYKHYLTITSGHIKESKKECSSVKSV